MKISTVRIKKSLSHNREFWVPSFFIIVSCLIFFARGIFFNKMSILWDTPNQFFPKLWYTAHVWRKGIVPLWNPFLFNGFPTFADPQSQTFYPFTFAMAFLTIISAKVVYLQLVLHYMLAGIFMYLFAGFYIKDVTGRLIASLIYMYNGFMINHFEHLTIINSIVWLPLILFFLEKGWRSRNMLYFAPTGLCIAFLIFAGHPQSTLYIFYSTVFFTLFKCFYSNGKRSFTVFPLVILISSMIFGVLLSAVQIIPTLEFLGLSNRSGDLPYVTASVAGQLTPSELITLFSPDYFGGTNRPYVGIGDIAQSSVYCGVVFLTVIPFSFIRRRRETFFFAGMALMALLISMGDYGYLFKAFYHLLPGFNLFHAPVRFRFVFAFFIALLAGIGIEQIAKGESLRRRTQYFYWIFMALLIMMFVYISPPDERVFSNVLVDALLFGVFFYASNVILFYWKKGKISVRVLQAAFILVAFFDFYAHGANAVTIGTKLPHKWFEKETPVVALLKEEMKIPREQKLGTPFLSSTELNHGLFRVYVDDEKKEHNRFLPYVPYDYLKLWMMNFNMASMHRIFMVDGYGPMMLKRYVLFNSVLRDKDYEKYLMLSGVKYVVKQSTAIEVLPDDKTMPRAYMVDKVVYRSNPDVIFETLSDPLFNVRKEAVIEEPLTLNGAGNCKRNSEAKIGEYLPNKVRLLTENDCPSLLVFSDTYYPGWEVEVKNSSTGEATKREAIKANYCFMGAFIPAGKNEVIFGFNPRSFRTGLIVSVMTALSGGIILLVVSFFRKSIKSHSKD